MKVLIITYYWPPAGGSGVQRWLKFVKYLPDFGISPIVYTVDDPNYSMIDESLVNEVPSAVELIKGKIWEPNQVLSLMGAKQKETSAGFLDSNPSGISRLMRFIRANVFIPDARMFWIKPSVKILNEYIEKNEIDAIISTGPPHSTHLIAMKLKEKYGLKWIADFRDPWTEIDYFHSLPLTKRSKRKHQELERKVLKMADRVIVVGKTMRDDFSKISKQVSVISNGYDTDDAQATVELDTKFTLSYAGLMNADRNPESLWRVLGELVLEDTFFANDFKLRIIGSVSDEVMRSIESAGLKHYLDYKGYIDHNKVRGYQESAQVLLLTVNKVASAKGIVTGKVFEYLQARRPILAIGPVDGDLAEIIQQTNAGQIFDFNDAKGIKEALISYHTAFKNDKLQIDSTHIEKYHRKNLTRELFELLKELQSFETDSSNTIS